MPQSPKRPASINFNPQTYDALRRHAFERNVSITKLINDILALWVRAASEDMSMSESMAVPHSLPLGLPPEPDGPSLDYLESLIVYAPEG